MWLDIGLCLLAGGLFFWAGWLFLRRSDYGSSGVLDRSQQTLFSLVFSLCCHQLFLLVCQVLNLLDPRYYSLFWL